MKACLGGTVSNHLSDCFVYCHWNHIALLVPSCFVVAYRERAMVLLLRGEDQKEFIGLEFIIWALIDHVLLTVVLA